MIGVFDSGIGGLTVVRELRQQLPGFSFVYLGDTARMPYGSKSPATIERYAIEDADFLLHHGAKLLVVACNTASATAVPALKRRFPNTPLFEVITPAVEAALHSTTIKRIGVIGTRATITSGIYERLLKEKGQGYEVLTQACPLLVPLIEEGWLKHPETGMILRRYLSSMKANTIDTLILGCTHYPLLREKIAKRMGRAVHLVDPAHETIAALKQYFGLHSDLAQQCRGQGQKFFFTDITDKTAQIACSWLGVAVKPEPANVPGD